MERFSKQYAISCRTLLGRRRKKEHSSATEEERTSGAEKEQSSDAEKEHICDACGLEAFEAYP